MLLLSAKLREVSGMNEIMAGSLLPVSEGSEPNSMAVREDRAVGSRRTIVVHTKLGGRTARVKAARAGANGVQILTMARLAARLAGGFIEPIEAEALQDAVRASLPSTNLGELEAIKTLPGMARAVVATLEKVWRAGIDLSALAGQTKSPRLEALAIIEHDVLRRLPPAMKRPRDLVQLAQARIRHAPAVLGPMEVHGHSEMSPCWRELLKALAEVVPVVWVAGPRYVPAWLEGSKIEVQRSNQKDAAIALFACATPQHEVLEAFRWMRALIASGTARPEEIAIAAASPADFDDHVIALSRDANLPIHFVHGIKAVATATARLRAALADVLVKGISQERVRRLFATAARGSPAIAGLPRDWPAFFRRMRPSRPSSAGSRSFAQVDADATGRMASTGQRSCSTSCACWRRVPRRPRKPARSCCRSCR